MHGSRLQSQEPRPPSFPSPRYPSVNGSAISSANETTSSHAGDHFAITYRDQ